MARSFLDQLARDSHRISKAAGDASAFQSGGTPRLTRRIARRHAIRDGYALLRLMRRRAGSGRRM